MTAKQDEKQEKKPMTPPPVVPARVQRFGHQDKPETPEGVEQAVSPKSPEEGEERLRQCSTSIGPAGAPHTYQGVEPSSYAVQLTRWLSLSAEQQKKEPKPEPPEPKDEEEEQRPADLMKAIQKGNEGDQNVEAQKKEEGKDKPPA